VAVSHRGDTPGKIDDLGKPQQPRLKNKVRHERGKEFHVGEAL
jgi:hypothetical protein